MKTLDRYILKDLALTFGLGLFALNFVIMTERVMRITMVFAQVGASPWDFVRIILYLQPQIAVFTTPLCLLISVLLVYGRMNADSEVVVLRTSGMPLMRLMRPALIMGIAATLLGYSLTFYLAPIGSRYIGALITQVLRERAPYAISEGLFTTNFPDVVIYVRGKPEPGKLSGIFLYDTREPDRPRTLYADRGTVESPDGLNLKLRLLDGQMHLGAKKPGDFTTVFFGRYDLSVPIPMRAPVLKHNEHMPMMLHTYAYLQPPGRERQTALIEFHERFMLPLLNLVIAVFGIPLAMMAGKTGKLLGLSLGLVVFATFYAGLAFFEGMARASRVPAFMGPWVPFIAVALFALWTYRREAAH